MGRFGIRFIIHRVHHVTYSYGWIVAPWLPVTVGFFPEFARRGAGHGAFHIVRGQYHDCTATGVF